MKQNMILKNQLEDLEFCLDTYLLAFEFIDQMRLMYDSETSNFLISEQEDETYLKEFELPKNYLELQVRKNISIRHFR